MEALQRGLSGGCIKQEHSDTVDEEGGGVEEELGGCARTNMPYYHSYLQYSHELAQRGGETVSIRKEEEEEETETQPQDVLQHAPVVYSFECPQQEPQPTRQQASLSWAQPDSNTESTASSTAISSRKRRGHRGKKKKRGMLVDVTSISSPPQLEQHQKRQHLRRQPLHQYVRPSSSSPAPHDKTLRQVILSRGQSGMEKEEEEEEEDDSGDEPYSPKLVIACDTDEECMVEGEEEQDTRQSHERSALSTSQANAQNKRWSQAPERNEEVAVMASSLPSPPPPSCPAVISSPVVRSHSTAHSTAAPARPAPMAVHRLDGFRLDSEQRDALKRLYEWRLRRDVGVIWCHSDVVRLCKKSTDNRRAKVTTVWVNDLQFVRSKPVFKVHRIDARDEEAGNPIEVYPYVSEEEEVDTKPIPIHHQPQVDGQGGLDNLTGQDESPSQEEIEVAQDSATEQHQTQSMVRAKGKEKEKGKDTGGQRTEGVCVVFDDIDQRSGEMCGWCVGS